MEPRVYPQDGQLFIPEIAIHRPQDIVICDVQVSWEGTTSLAESCSYMTTPASGRQLIAAGRVNH